MTFAGEEGGERKRKMGCENLPFQIVDSYFGVALEQPDFRPGGVFRVDYDLKKKP